MDLVARWQRRQFREAQIIGGRAKGMLLVFQQRSFPDRLPASQKQDAYQLAPRALQCGTRPVPLVMAACGVKGWSVLQLSPPSLIPRRQPGLQFCRRSSTCLFQANEPDRGIPAAVAKELFGVGFNHIQTLDAKLDRQSGIPQVARRRVRAATLPPAVA